MILHLDEFDEGESLRRLHLDVPAEQLKNLLDDTGYRACSDLTAELDTNLVGTTVRIRGPLTVEVEFECGRCLEHRHETVTLDAEFVLMEKSEWSAKYESEEDIELADDDMDVSFYSGKDIDLAPLVREAIILELPILPRCPDSDRAACDEAYRRNVGEVALKELEEATLDQRWSALKNIKLKD